MSWDASVFATLRLDARALDRWRKASLPTLDLPAGFPTELGRAKTVRGVLSALERRVEILETRPSDAEWSFCAIVPKDVYHELGASLVRAFAAAGALGATGELLVYGGLTGPHELGFRWSRLDISALRTSRPGLESCSSGLARFGSQRRRFRGSAVIP
jgi:hypothetical protein